MIEDIPNNLLDLINAGECTTIEFKTARKHLPDNLFETICAMLNVKGGNIFLGVKDDGTIVGVYRDYIKEMKKNFINLCNNNEKISPTIHPEIKEYQYDGKIILYIYVYESSDVHKTCNKVYVRKEDGDFDITGNTSMISELYIRKSSTYIENKIYPYATIDDLRSDLIEKARKMATNRVANHPWRMMNDIELLKSASLYERNIQTGEEGINLAGILLLGRDEVISSALSYYKTDAILRIKDIDRYDDRDDIRTNLIDSYDRLIAFIQKHTNDSFYLDGDKRIDIRDIIARELCVNLLVHREYSNPIPARLIITKDMITAENANKPRNIGYIDLNNYIPFPKNPKIASFFKEIGLADELGSGIKKIAKYSRIYSGHEPTFKDDEIFVATVPIGNIPEKINTATKIDLKDIIFEFIKNNSGVSRREINEYILKNYSSDEVRNVINRCTYAMRYLKEKEYIINNGSDAKPEWIAK